MEARVITLEEIKTIENLWLASTGSLETVDDGVVWEGLIIPTKMKILNIAERTAPNHIFDAYSYIYLTLDGLTDTLDYRVDTYGKIETKYRILIGIEETDIVDLWLEQLRRLLKDTWSGINNNNLNGVLKRYMIDKEYDYFNSKYPEMLV